MTDKPASPPHQETQAIHAGRQDPSCLGAVSVPIFQSSTFAFPSAAEGAARFAGQSPGYIYTRVNNPTVNALEASLAALENGAAALATATGMAAITTVLLSLLSHSDHVVAGDCLYGPTSIVLARELPRFGIATTPVDTTSLSAVEQAFRPQTRLLYIETPANPNLDISDIQALADLAHRHGALLAVDNTFASPVLQRPLDLGADIVIHSLTKYINGHSDVLGGMIVVRDPARRQTLKRTLTLFGATMDPHQAWLIHRGVATLPLRMAQAQDNAQRLALFLSRHPKVLWVRYPGLSSHPQHDLARRQMHGFGAMLSFGVLGGLAGGIALMDHVRLITLAVSLGGVESLIEHPASMTHAGVPPEERLQAGITDELVRLSVGCEAYEDLEADLEQALAHIR